MQHQCGVEKVHNLSGGEQQRVALARVMLKGCDLLLADEPTGSLDEGNRDIVLDVLDRLNQDGASIVLVSHDVHVISRFATIVDLDKACGKSGKTR